MPGSGPVLEITLYTDAPAPVEVFRSPRGTLSMQALARQYAADPAAPDTGAIVIITRSTREEGPARHQWLVTDGHVIPDPRTGETRDLAAAALPDIVIGQPWHSPLGPTPPVRAVR